jgi:hypothetical protein
MLLRFPTLSLTPFFARPTSAEHNWSPFAERRGLGGPSQHEVLLHPTCHDAKDARI